MLQRVLFSVFTQHDNITRVSDYYVYESMKCHAVTTLPFTPLAATVPNSGNSKACLIDRSKKREETLHDLTFHATVHRHMKAADVCPKISEISVGSSDQNIWDHLWKWSSYFGQPKFSDSSIFDKPVHHCRTSPHLCSEFGKRNIN